MSTIRYLSNTVSYSGRFRALGSSYGILTCSSRVIQQKVLSSHLRYRNVHSIELHRQSNIHGMDRHMLF